MIDFAEARALLAAGPDVSPELLSKLAFVGFEDLPLAVQLLQTSTQGEFQQTALAEILPGLLYALAETADSDRSIRNFHRYVSAVQDREQFFQTLIENPRSVEILVRLFVGSQFLTEILLRWPHYLDRLTAHKRLAEFKSREEFIEDAQQTVGQPRSLQEFKERLRSFHQWEILRIAACDTFGLMDLRTVTLQLSLLADAIVQTALNHIARLTDARIDHFAVIAFGKLGGLELNYSSDIDLVFVCGERAERYVAIGQKLINVLAELTSTGFIYRVDMRLRPWGNSGPLVTAIGPYIEYFGKYAQLWERQALLKARTIAGDFALGDELLQKLRQRAFEIDPDKVRLSIRAMKDQIEEKAARHPSPRGGVKGGPGGIRDIEFLVQYLQFIHGNEFPHIRRVGTQDGLIGLSDANLLNALEFRTLSTAYVILRTIEHSLQLMHNQPEYHLPESARELAYLARRLDFPNADLFLSQYEKHTQAVKKIFDRHLRMSTASSSSGPDIDEESSTTSAEPGAESQGQSNDHFRAHGEHLFGRLNDEIVVAVEAHACGSDEYDVLIAGYDHLGDLPMICGLLFAYGFDVVSGKSETFPETVDSSERRTYLNRFHVRSTSAEGGSLAEKWEEFAEELNELLRISISGQIRQAQKKLIHKLAATIQSQPDPAEPLLPVEISFVQDAESNTTILYISGTDVPGFLFELTNAISVSGLSIERMIIRSKRDQVFDTLYVVDPAGGHLLDVAQQNRLRAAVVLIKHFTHLLPHAPNPEAALLHFRELLSNMFDQADWLDQLQTLQQPQVLAAVARLLGFSDFLWEDFLRLQHQNLFPVVTDLSGLQESHSREELAAQLCGFLGNSKGVEAREALNEFKDRAMMRVDMRHILNLQTEFGSFSRELTAVAETIVDAAMRICLSELQEKFGVPTGPKGEPCRLVVCALGKCGGHELGYASDIELMFLYDCDGFTNGRHRISNVEFYQRLVDQFRRTIFTRQKRIFEIDLRLRPYGNAGSLAVSRDAFAAYFCSTGPAWPYERQALVKLRPIAGDKEFSREIVELRDELIYIGEPFDLSAMRAMREKQIRQLVQPGTFHAKLSPGGLVDCEYFVQGMQLTFGHLSPAIREPNTREAIKGLEQLRILTSQQRIQLRDAYRFLRRLIDAMRMVRGDATDLTIPKYGTEQFEFLSKRLGIQSQDLHQEIELQTCRVIELIVSFEELITKGPRSAAEEQ